MDSANNSINMSHFWRGVNNGVSITAKGLKKV